MLKSNATECDEQQTYVELSHLVFDVALGEVLHVGELEVHLCEPDQDPLTGPLEVFSLRGEVLQERRARRGRRWMLKDAQILSNKLENLQQNCNNLHFTVNFILIKYVFMLTC